MTKDMDSVEASGKEDLQIDLLIEDAAPPKIPTRKRKKNEIQGKPRLTRSAARSQEQNVSPINSSDEETSSVPVKRS